MLPCEVCTAHTYRRAQAHGSCFVLCWYCGGLDARDRVSAERRELWRRIDVRTLLDIYAVRMWADAVRLVEWQRKRRPDGA